MKGQRGSILVGVIGLSIAMTLAAGGLIVMSANSTGSEAGSNRDLQLHYAADAGMQMGLRWTRYYPPGKFGYPPGVPADAGNWLVPETDYIISKNAAGVPGFTTIDGMQVEVIIRYSLNPANFAPHLLRVIAKDGVNPGALETKLWITLVQDRNAPGLASTADRADWRESYLP